MRQLDIFEFVLEQKEDHVFLLRVKFGRTTPNEDFQVLLYMWHKSGAHPIPIVAEASTITKDWNSELKSIKTGAFNNFPEILHQIIQNSFSIPMKQHVLSSMTSTATSYKQTELPLHKWNQVFWKLTKSRKHSNASEQNTWWIPLKQRVLTLLAYIATNYEKLL